MLACTYLLKILINTVFKYLIIEKFCKLATVFVVGYPHILCSSFHASLRSDFLVNYHSNNKSNFLHPPWENDDESARN